MNEKEFPTKKIEYLRFHLTNLSIDKDFIKKKKKIKYIIHKTKNNMEVYLIPSLAKENINLRL